MIAAVMLNALIWLVGFCVCCLVGVVWLVRRAPVIASAPFRPTYSHPDELDTIRGKWFRQRELMELDAARCCEIFGIDPNADSDARDIAGSIVLLGADVEDVIRQLERIRS